jgi:hypothetical protein
MQSLRRSTLAFLKTRRFKWVAAGLATTSAVSVAFLTTLVLTNYSPVEVPADKPAVRIDLEGLEALEGLAAIEGLEVLKDLDIERLRAEIVEQLSEAGIAAFESAPVEVYVPESRVRSGQALMTRVTGDIVGLLAAFVAMCSLGFGLVFYAPHQLEVVADTVRHAFVRSFLIGLLAQPLVVPAIGLLLLVLAITVVGLLVIPFAALAFVAALVLGVVGGYLAVARSIGETYLRRRGRLGRSVGGWLAYRYLVYGLLTLSTVWLPAVLFGWAPVAGDFFTASAILLSWIIATAGFGAMILSRAGIRGTFTGQLDKSLSDEYLFRTPRATRAVRS